MPKLRGTRLRMRAPDSSSEHVPQTEMDSPVILFHGKSFQLIPVIEPGGSDRSLDANPHARRIANVLFRGGLRILFWMKQAEIRPGHVVHVLPCISGVEKDSPLQDPHDRKTKLNISQKKEVARPDVLLAITTNRRRASDLEATAIGDPF